MTSTKTLRTALATVAIAAAALLGTQVAHTGAPAAPQTARTHTVTLADGATPTTTPTPAPVSSPAGNNPWD
ncbi:hypothetical protein ACFO3J_16910 [Streptomyces polygonati]|uniref:Uncharacterized protein n=1 Tax=Streptomyces polygonati TaxID=1617087 RepID=A0ABV8HMJ4_9ACTN